MSDPTSWFQTIGRCLSFSIPGSMLIADWRLWALVSSLSLKIVTSISLIFSSRIAFSRMSRGVDFVPSS